MTKEHDPREQCCPHPKKQHSKLGFKPCTATGCPCRSWWKRQALPKATAAK